MQGHGYFSPFSAVYNASCTETIYHSTMDKKNDGIKNLSGPFEILWDHGTIALLKQVVC
jgi:hypothetical protein